MISAVTIQLTRGLTACIDAEDAELVSQFTWCADASRSRHYAATRRVYDGRVRKIYMHRLLAGFPDDKWVDHINGNGLDNRRCNLRDATPQQNEANSRKKRPRGSSRFKGVGWDKKTCRWVAKIKINYKDIWLGRHDTEIGAAMAYDKAARAAWGDFSRLNFSKASEQ